MLEEQHSIFMLPLNTNPQEESVCSMRKNGAIAKVLQKTVIIC